jgi:hypothetical protein
MSPPYVEKERTERKIGIFCREQEKASANPAIGFGMPFQRTDNDKVRKQTATVKRTEAKRRIEGIRCSTRGGESNESEEGACFPPAHSIT